MRQSFVLRKKGYTIHPGQTHRGGKNLAWRPKFDTSSFLPLGMEHPPRRPRVWHEMEFRRLGMVEWPKEVGFFNAGDNWELTPEMMWRLFLKNNDAEFWSQELNEKTVIHQMPLVEADPVQYMPRCDTVFQHHVKRFGPDHVIYNVVMQASAFSKDFDRCQRMFDEMNTLQLVPNAQTYVNLMLAVMLCKKPREKAEEFFKDAVRTGTLHPVMRLDTEFDMWWDQLKRMGSFTSGSGFLSNSDEGAKPRPRDMWALWGWDNEERKFISRSQRVKEEILRRQLRMRWRRGSVVTVFRRQPWYKYKGMIRKDWIQPPVQHIPQPFPDAPPHDPNYSMCQNVFAPAKKTTATNPQP